MKAESRIYYKQLERRINQFAHKETSMAKQRKQDKQYFRITMLPSWEAKLRALDVEQLALLGLKRVVVRKVGGSECVMVVRVEHHKRVEPTQASAVVRTLLDGFEGWMRVEELTRAAGEEIEDYAQEEAAFAAALEPKKED